MADAGARVPKMAERCFRVPTTPQSPTLLQRQNTSEEDVGCVATLAYRPNAYPRKVER